MATKKPAAKVSTKTEPAASKGQTAAPRPKVDKKKPPKETATPAPVPEAVVPLSEHEKVKSDLRTAKLEISTEKYSTKMWRKKAEEIEADLQRVTNETTGWINRGNKWVFAAVPVIILGVWIFFLNRHKNNLEKTVQDKNTVIESKDRQIQNLKDEVHYDTTHAANNGIQVPDAAESKKKILTGNKP